MMITYQEQYQRCAADNKVAWSALREVKLPIQLIVGGRVVGGHQVVRRREALCGRFGGLCEDHNEQCRKFRERE